ncbi:hypothetical protein SBV1_130119 [Verrucomicrobia bacterium]|nr:hypothetical protein SBV1_130119 [Verrucomicrobiota bacterium]
MSGGVLALNGAVSLNNNIVTVPEPASFWLMVFGASFVGIRPWLAVWRRKLVVVRCRVEIVRQFHDIVEVAVGLVAPDMEQGQLAGMLAGDLFEALDAFELAPEGPVILEGVAPNDLGGAQDAGGLAASQPDVTIGAAADAAEQVIIGNGGEAGWSAGEGGSFGRRPAPGRGAFGVRLRADCLWLVHRAAVQYGTARCKRPFKCETIQYRGHGEGVKIQEGTFRPCFSHWTEEIAICP